VQHLTFSVVELLDHPGEYRDIRINEPVTGVRTALATLEEDPVKGELRAESVVEGVLITGRLTGRAEFRCARCVSVAQEPVSVEVCELFAKRGQDVPPESDAYEIAGTEVHLEPMLRDALALALPLNPLCREDCKGLCPHCGMDLNEGQCDCRDEETDPRWAPLEALREKLTAPE
jgi:uncharacterized protein